MEKLLEERIWGCGRSSNIKRVSVMDAWCISAGDRVEDVTKHAVIGVAVNHAAIDYEIAHQPEHRALAVSRRPRTGQGVQQVTQDSRQC